MGAHKSRHPYATAVSILQTCRTVSGPRGTPRTRSALRSATCSPPASHSQGPGGRACPPCSGLRTCKGRARCAPPASRVITSLRKAAHTPVSLAPPQPAEPSLTCLLHNMIYSTDSNFPKSRLTELIMDPLTTIFTQHQLQFLKIQRLHYIMFYFNLLKIELLTETICC